MSHGVLFEIPSLCAGVATLRAVERLFSGVLALALFQITSPHNSCIDLTQTASLENVCDTTLVGEHTYCAQAKGVLPILTPPILKFHFAVESLLLVRKT